MTITDRQRVIVELVAAGHTNQQIGAEMHLSEAAVKDALKRLRTKMGATNRAHLVHRCHHLGLLLPQPASSRGYPTVAQMIAEAQP